MKIFQVLVIALLLVFVPGGRAQDKSPRAYYDELKKAGGFVDSVTDDKGEKLSFPAGGYVCFAEDNSAADAGGLFLTFEAMAYDKYYAEAEAIFVSNASTEDKAKALLKMENIQWRQPYIGSFLTNS